jgi:hypothetical protein
VIMFCHQNADKITLYWWLINPLKCD